MYIETKDNYIIKIGRNAKENDELVKNSPKTSLWLHLGDNRPSPHGIIENLNENENEIDKNIIYYVGCLIKKFSKYKYTKLVSIEYLPLISVKPSLYEIGLVYLIKTPKTIMC